MSSRFAYKMADRRNKARAFRRKMYSLEEAVEMCTSSGFNVHEEEESDGYADTLI